MYRVPSAKRRKKKYERLNLIPILDAVFIFIFFLLMSANFIKVFEISSDIPIVSDEPPPEDKKKPLALTLSITADKLTLSAGIPARVLTSFGKIANGEYDLNSLHSYLIDIKKKNLHEESIILEPKVDLEYKELIKIMDAVRLLQRQDEAIFRKSKEGLEEKIKTLFNNIVFGNLMS